MESRRSVYDEDVIMFVSDSNDSDLGADIEIGNEQDSSIEIPLEVNRVSNNRANFLDEIDSEIEDAFHDELTRFIEPIQHLVAEDLELLDDESTGSTIQYSSQNRETIQNQDEVQNQVVAAHEEIKSPIKNKDSNSNKNTEANTSSEDDGMICTICFEAWTCSGEHRLVSLRCGHLFGRKCIAKWVKNRDAKCPQCNARARKSEIRPIYAKTVKTLDTSERDWAVKELEKESELRKKAEMEAGRKKMECDMLRTEIEGMKLELIMLQCQLKEARSVGGKQLPKLASRTTIRTFTRVQQIDMKSSGCRIMDCSSILGMLAVSQPSTNPLFPGHGLRKVSVPDGTLCEFVHIHQKPIKDISFRHTDGCILTASLDKSVKLINFLSNSVVQTYTLDCDVWSCCWDNDNSNYFYAGVSSGSVYVFDLRMTDRYLSQLPSSGEKSPVVSLQYLPRQQSAKYCKCGPIVGQLGSCCFYEKHSFSNSYVAKPLPLDGRFTSLSVESTTNHLLASCRPSLKHTQVTHTLCELSCDTTDFSCNFVHSMTGGRTQAQLTRSKLMLHPDNENTVLVCAGDEESKSTLVWNGCTGSLIDKFPVDSPILDVTTFRWDKPFLVTLTDKFVYFYKWNNF